MEVERLNGWNYLVYTVIKSKFKHNIFSLKDINAFFDEFKSVYPNNFHIEAKIRQTLQNLNRFEIIHRIEPGVFQMKLDAVYFSELEKGKKDYVYLVSNVSIPGWVKIGRTNSIKNRMKSLYNSSVPFPFKVEKIIETKSMKESLVIEKGIHSFIDTVNPSLRKETEAKKREFFKLPVEKGIEIFNIIENMLSYNLHS